MYGVVCIIAHYSHTLHHLQNEVIFEFVAGTQFEKTFWPVQPVQKMPVSALPCFSSGVYYWVSLVSVFCCSGLIVPMLAGASAGVVSRIICHPIDTIKSKLQVEVVAERGVYCLNPKPLPNTQHF